ncbi:MAG: DUF488 family protein [Gammaproteobacteria bacterium]|nr:DUF488 family protein [Gammaproteobacteria bacterium]
MFDIATKRIYLPAAAGDGCRVLVDRLWPRGLKKDAVRLDYWLRELAPSDSLRKCFGHEPAKWDEFRRRYHAELKANKAALAPLRGLLQKQKKVTLLFSAKDEEHNNAVALAEYLRLRH